MGDEFTRKILTSVVAQVSSQLGWHSIHATPMNILVDLLHRHLNQICVQTHRYSEQFNQTVPNLDHLGLAFQDLGIRIQELEDFVQNVDSTPLSLHVPKYPMPKDNHLNFLKPGSNEVVHRPVHVHEHLPPMHPDLEEESKPVTALLPGDVSTGDTMNGTPTSPNASMSPVFKRPSDLLESPAMKRVRLTMEEEGGRPLREISSVIMTTSGFLSPAREGKLPEAKAPVIPADYLDHPTKSGSAATSQPVATSTPTSKADKKKASSKPVHNVPKKKDVPAKKKEVKTEKKEESNQPPPPKKKKVASMKELDKLKALKQITVRKLPPTPAPTEKLSIDPDKQKLNIFKKMPKVKEELLKNSRESSPSLTITEVTPKHEEARRLANYDSVIDSVLKEPKGSSNKSSSKSKSANNNPNFCSPFLQIEMVVEDEVILSDAFSPPHTPSAPKTPEILSKADRMAEKRRKREKKQKNRAPKEMGMVIEEEVIDDDIIEENFDRPKTPEALMPPVFPFQSRFPAPGLIPPPPLSSPLLSGLPFPGVEPSHPAMPNLPLPPPMFMQQKSDPIIEEEPASTEVMEEVVETENIIEKSKDYKKEKKDDKDKDKKIKKKKDKKDKNKNKERGEKKREEKKEKVKEKKDKKEKKKDRERDERADTSSPAIPKLTLKIGPSSPRPPTPDAPRKLVIKPIVMKEEEPENPPELAKFAPLITRPPKQKSKEQPLYAEPSSSKKLQPPPPQPPPPAADIVAFYYHDGSQKKSSRRRSSASEPPSGDEAGNKVWICPACNGPDDGTPMIGCDDCDAWYHWVCVGIQVPPEDDVNWYCKDCIVRKQGNLSIKKKKKTKKV